MIFLATSTPLLVYMCIPHPTQFCFPIAVDHTDMLHSDMPPFYLTSPATRVATPPIKTPNMCACRALPYPPLAGIPSARVVSGIKDQRRKPGDSRPPESRKVDAS